MSRIPEPETSPDGPAYEGRLLDRADEEVVDQGVSFDVRTLLSRRTVLSLLGIGAGSLALAACTRAASGASRRHRFWRRDVRHGCRGATTAVGEIPDETAGPYPGDGSNGVDVLERRASSAATSGRALGEARPRRACPCRCS